METLRRAMLHTEGPVPGNITLTIARRAPSPAPNRTLETKSSEHNAINGNSSAVIENNKSNDTEPSLSENSGTSGGSTNTVIFNPLKSPSDGGNKQIVSPLSPMNTWNPVLDRLMGQNKQLRNESYYKVNIFLFLTSFFFFLILIISLIP